MKKCLNIFRNFLYGLIIITIFTSCVGNRRMKKLINLGEMDYLTSYIDNVDSNEYLLKNITFQGSDLALKIKRKEYYFIPLIIYFGAKSSYLTSPDLSIRKDRIVQNMKTILENERALHKKLFDRKLSIDINFDTISIEVPYVREEHLVILYFYYFTTLREFAGPIKSTITASFTVKEDGNIISSGKLNHKINLPIPIRDYTEKDKVFMKEYMTTFYDSFIKESRIIATEIFESIPNH